MTEPEQQQPKEHCYSEGVCINYLGTPVHKKKEPCKAKTGSCKHDTRSRPHPAPQHPKEPNPDMNYSALERLDIKFTELIGAIEEKQVDGQLSNKDHGDYELICYCRGIIRAELEKERRSRPTPAPAYDGGHVGFAWLKDHDAAIERKAREEVLEELRDMYIQAFSDDNVPDMQKNTLKMVDKWVESLRQQQGGQEKEP